MSELRWNVEPGLLSSDELRAILKAKGVDAQEGQSKNELVELYIKHIQPLPQRAKKTPATKSSSQACSSRSVLSKTTSFICTKTKNISILDEDDVSKNYKKFKSNEPSVNPRPVQKIKLRRIPFNVSISTESSESEKMIVDEETKS